MRHLFPLIVFLTLIQGCTTNYNRTNPHAQGPIWDKQTGDDTFALSIRGNLFDSKQRMHDFILLRCAELTLESGNKYFVFYSEEVYDTYDNYEAGVAGYGTIRVHADKPEEESYNADEVFGRLSKKYNTKKRKIPYGIVLSDEFPLYFKYEKDGLFVERVIVGSTMHQAGVRRGDVLYSINRIRMDMPFVYEKSLPFLKWERKLDVVVYRDGLRKEVTAVVQK